MARSIKSSIEVIRRLGPKSLTVRCFRALGLKSGYSALRRPIHTPSNESLDGENYPSPSSSPEDFFAWWKQQKVDCYQQDPIDYQQQVPSWLSPQDITELKEKATKASKGTISAFRSWEADYGYPIKWDLDPVTRNQWPNNIHSLKIGHQPSDGKLKDIKYVWEIARFIHLADIIRYLYLTPDEQVARDTIDQIKSFEKNNPVNCGVNWISEQEVALRTAMFVRLLYALKATNLLRQEDALLLMRQIVAGADYCYEENYFARHCIANNHYLAGAIGMYIPAVLFPWHPNAKKWRKRGRRDILESLGQWNSEGGYIQPAHNYHRLALNYLLQAKELADHAGDQELSTILIQKIELSERFLYEFLDQKSGQLPNWGPNDGAQFCAWTNCQYEDFRPSLVAAQQATKVTTSIEPGPWDELCFWNTGASPKPSTTERSQKTNLLFKKTGLQILRSDSTETSGFFRTGPITSRYGQQADLLHLDVFHKGRNILVDSGSYAYGETEYHNWFRSVFAHNTVHILGQDQMTPFSKFLYINWPKSKLIDTSVIDQKEFTAIAAAQHNGYDRVHKGLIHKRSVGLHKKGFFIVIDRLSAPTPFDQTAVLRWNFAHAPYSTQTDHINLDYPEGKFQSNWTSNNPTKVTILEGSQNPIGGWHARTYGRKTASVEVQIKAPVNSGLMFLSLIGPSSETANERIEIINDQASLNGKSLFF